MSFTIAKCQVEINFLFVAVIAFLLLIDRSALAGLGIVATVVHECGHILCMYYFSVPPVKVKFNPFGIDIIENSGRKRSYGHDALIALAGPGANALVFAVFLLFNSLLPNTYFYSFCIANGAFAAFNLLPIEPLDGGQTLYCVLCSKYSPATSAKTVEIISFFILLPLAVLGFLLLFQSRYNFSLLFVSGYLMLLLIMKRGRYF
ncbi:MAG TPA: peptidase M50 [Oscillospiraceae bacterium]|nr:peptidase M50 [Oscillospiraceae bacterium]